MLLSEARAPGRLDDDGTQVLLEDADRSRWDAALTAEGLRLCARSLSGGPPGQFGLQAAIAAEHATASSLETTGWARIVELYGALLTLEPSPTVALGRSVAVSYLAGPQVGLADLDGVLAVGVLNGYPYAHAARAQMLARLGRGPESRRAWIRAAACARTTAERYYFTGRAARSGSRG